MIRAILTVSVALAAAPAVAQPYHYQQQPSYAPLPPMPQGKPWWLPQGLPPSDPSLHIPDPEPPPPRPPPTGRQP